MRWASAMLCLPMLALLPGHAEAPSIYHPSQKEADEALSAFDANNSTCQLWTNWRKLCSRTGEGGGTVCQKAKVAVKPSTPFCIAKTDEPYMGLTSGYTAQQLASYLRFCEKRTGELSVYGVPLCTWSKQRPFNGLRVAELKHSWCVRWRRDATSKLKIREQDPAGFYCSDQRIPEWCVWPEGLGYGRQDGQASPTDAYIGVINRPSGIPANGVYCRRKVVDAQQWIPNRSYWRDIDPHEWESGVTIGDDIMLRAGHVMFEFNENSETLLRPPRSKRDSV